MSLEHIQAAERQTPNQNYILEVRTGYTRKSIVVFRDAKYMHFVSHGWMRRFGIGGYVLLCSKQHDIGGVQGLWGSPIGEVEVTVDRDSAVAAPTTELRTARGAHVQHQAIFWPTPTRFDPAWLKEPTWGGPPEIISYAAQGKPHFPRSLLNRLQQKVKCRCGNDASREWELMLSEPTGERSCTVPLCDGCGPVLFDFLAENGWLSRPTVGETFERAQRELAASVEKK